MSKKTIRKLYYASLKELPCCVCGKPTLARARFWGKRVGIPLCISTACRASLNPFRRTVKYVTDVDGRHRAIPPVEPLWWGKLVLTNAPLPSYDAFDFYGKSIHVS